MKIEGQKPATANSTKKLTKKGSGFSSSFLGSLDTLEPSISPSAPSNISSVGTLTALQTISYDAGEKFIQKAEIVLDDLDQLRTQILLGRVKKSSLLKIEKMIGEQLTKTLEPELKSILDDINLRAKVELAKLSL